MAHYRNQEHSWFWVASKNYDYWSVFKYMNGDTSRGTYPDSLSFRTKKDAEKVASALNAAYNAGVSWGRHNAMPHDEYPHTDRTLHGCKACERICDGTPKTNHIGDMACVGIHPHLGETIDSTFSR